MFLVQVDPQVRSFLKDLHAQYSETGVGRYLPGVFLRIVVHDGPQDHQLDAAAFQQGHLVLLAQLRETVDLLRHLDDSLYGELSQVDDTKKW